MNDYNDIQAMLQNRLKNIGNAPNATADQQLARYQELDGYKRQKDIFDAAIGQGFKLDKQTTYGDAEAFLRSKGLYDQVASSSGFLGGATKKGYQGTDIGEAVGYLDSFNASAAVARSAGMDVGENTTFADLTNWSTQNQSSFNAKAGTRATQGVTAISDIGSPVEAPTLSGNGPTLPKASGASASAQYTTSLTQQLDNSRKALLDESNKRAAEYQKQIDDIAKKQADLQVLQDAGIEGNRKAVQEEVEAKKAALELEKQRFDENYNANQQLTNELDGLLTQGNEIIRQMQETTGLSSIMSPRISKTISDVQARAGVIQAVMSARNGQMSYAQQQLNTTVNVLSSIAQDEINYYNTIVDYYQNLKDENGKKLMSLEGDQKEYLDMKLQTLAAQMDNVQATANMLSEAMLDPDTAGIYGAAGVSLNDSPAQITKKLADYEYTQELTDLSNQMAAQGYTSKKVAGVEPVPITDSRGKTKNWYPTSSSAGAAPSSTTKTTAPASKTTTTLTGLKSGNTFVSGNLQYGPTDYDEDRNTLLSTTIKDAQGNPNRGADGYSNPSVYLQLYNAWIGQGGLKSDFLKVYPINDYINPKNTWPEIVALGGGTKPKATSSSSKSSGSSRGTI